MITKKGRGRPKKEAVKPKVSLLQQAKQIEKGKSITEVEELTLGYLSGEITLSSYAKIMKINSNSAYNRITRILKDMLDRDIVKIQFNPKIK